jgi:predicted dehydrogenase
LSDIRVAVIGLGLVAEAHLNAFDLVDDARIVAVCDIRGEVAAKVASAHNAKAYSDYRLLLREEQIDLAMVLTPASTHLDVVRASAEAGAHIFCEKPIAVTVEDADEIVRICDEAGLKLFYGSCYRYLPAVSGAYELIRQGVIGDVQLMFEQGMGGRGLEDCSQLSFAHYPEGGPGGPAWGLMDHGVHLVDIFSWFADSEIIDVSGRGNISGGKPAAEMLTMRFANAAVGHLLYDAATFSTALPGEGMFSGGQGYRDDGGISEPGSWDASPVSISVYGSKGSLRIFYYANTLFLNTGEGPKQIALTGRAPFGHFATQLEACIDAISSDLAPPIGGRVGRSVLTTILKIYQ